MFKKHLLFIDWDGTLCWSRFWQSLSGGEEMLKIQENLFGLDRTLVDDWMRGKYSSEEINRLVAEWTGYEYDFLWEHFVASCQNMNFDKRFKTMLEKIRESAFVVLATGNMDCFKRFTVPALGLEEIFDKIMVSSDLGFLKTEKDGEFFLSTAREFGVPIENSFLVEDSRKTCEFFERFGGRAFCVNGPEATVSVLENLCQFVKLDP